MIPMTELVAESTMVAPRVVLSVADGRARRIYHWAAGNILSVVGEHCFTYMV